MEDALPADFSEALVKLSRGGFDREYWHSRTPSERLGIAVDGPMEKVVVVKNLKDRT